jgi:hypothetical protein
MHPTVFSASDDRTAVLVFVPLLFILAKLVEGRAVEAMRDGTHSLSPSMLTVGSLTMQTGSTRAAHDLVLHGTPMQAGVSELFASQGRLLRHLQQKDV